MLYEVITITSGMQTSTPKQYNGRVFGPQQIEQVRAIIRAHPQASRQQLSYRVCEELDWRKADGGLKVV